MTYSEFLKRQKKLLDECNKLQKSNMFCKSFDKMKEYLDLVEQYLTETSISNKINLLLSRNK